MRIKRKILLASLAVLLLAALLGGCTLPQRGQKTPTAVATGAAQPSQTPLVIVITESPGPTQTPHVIVVTATPLPVTATPLSTLAPPPPTATPVPTLPPSLPPVSDLQALIAYAEAVQPILEAGLEAAERDGQIVEASKEDEAALCGGGLNPHPTLLADAALMDNLVLQLEAIVPPPEAINAVHKPLRESASLWGEVLDNINLSCQTSNQLRRGLLRAGAVLQVWGSALNFRIAAENFYLLLLANGLEELANP